jgi:hypothetical protein
MESAGQQVADIKQDIRIQNRLIHRTRTMRSAAIDKGGREAWRAELDLCLCQLGVLKERLRVAKEPIEEAEQLNDF